MEPAVDYDLLGCFGVFVVAQHYVGTLDAYFAFAVFVRFVNHKLDAGERQTDRTVIMKFGTVDGDERSAFGDAVAVYKGYADIGEEFGNIRLEGCAAADDGLAFAAEGFKHIPEEYSAHIDADFQQCARGFYELFEQLGLALFVDFVPGERAGPRWDDIP